MSILLLLKASVHVKYPQYCDLLFLNNILEQLDSLKNFVSKGGSVFFFSNEGGDIKQGTNANDLLQDYGITIKANCLVIIFFYC